MVECRVSFGAVNIALDELLLGCPVKGEEYGIIFQMDNFSHGSLQND